MRESPSTARYVRWLRDQTYGVDDGSIPLAAYDCLEHPRVLLIDEAGSGATAFVRHVAWLLCCGLEDTHADSLMMPILLRAADVPSSATLSGMLAAREADWGLEAGYFRRRLADGACLVMLDGMEDEAEARMMESAAAEFPNCRFLATARPGVPSLAGFATVRLLQSSFTCP